ncbi:MAG: rhomboid family intramembrane serine protease [Kiritimatiellae bacterium]|nr:rhomboid family intramembrane serine protease [Kiritimatiellia bacterium]
MTWDYESRYPRPGGMTPAVRALLIANIAVFFVVAIADRATGRLFTHLLGLSAAGLARGFVWQPLTYMFLHGSAWHLFINMLVLFFMGRETERTMGTRHFVTMYLLSGVLGGIGWIIISRAAVPCVGASGAVFGVLGAFAALYPNRPVTLLVMFVLPVTMKAWVLVVVLGLFELAFLVSGVEGNIAYAAHLSGIVAGYVYGLTFRGGGAGPSGWLSRRRGALGRGLPRQADIGLSAEVDRILDKVAREGIHSLTAAEREILERASRRG